MKTVKELTVSLQLSKVTIYKALKRDDLQEHIIKKDNITYVAEKGEQILIKIFSKTSSKTNSKLNEQSIKDDVTIQALINQLEVKDKQIADLTETIKNLSESIKTERHNELAETIIDSQSSLSPPKKSLWNKLFERKD